jgi:hypothetical protein
MSTNFGPWATAIEAATAAPLSALWRDRMQALVHLNTAGSGVTRRQALAAGLAVLALCAMPTLTAVAAVEPEWLAVEDLVATHVTFKPALLDESESADLAEVTGLAVRGVFPLEEQVANIASQQPEGKPTGAELFQLLDFVVERQSLPPERTGHEEPEWERLTLNDIHRLLGAVDGFAPEIVAEHTNPVITMPLPMRADGEWNDSELGHPKLRDNEARGLLFRFLDTDVKPGFYYRYRVKLIVQNPTREWQGDDPFIGLGETRETPWSRPSRAVRVGRE